MSTSPHNSKVLNAHIDDDILVEHLANVLEPKERQKVIAHLNLCDQCTDRLVELSEPIDIGPIPTGEEREQKLKAMNKHIAMQKRLRRQKWYQMAASFFLITTLALSHWLLQRPRDVKGITFSVSPIEQNRSLAPEVLKFNSEASTLILLLSNHLKTESAVTAKVYIDQINILTVTDLLKNESGSYTLVIPREKLKPGILTIDLMDENQKRLHQYKRELTGL